MRTGKDKKAPFYLSTNAKINPLFATRFAHRTRSWRCTEVLVAGRFNSWEAYYMNETTMQTVLNETATFPCKQGIARLVYDWEHEKYLPSPVSSNHSFPDIALNRTDSDVLTSVNYATRAPDGQIYAGGEFAKFNNIYKMSLPPSGRSNLEPLVSPTSKPSRPSPKDPFYKCMSVHEKNQTGEMVLNGAR